MDFTKFFYSCKIGDLNKVKYKPLYHLRYLVEQKEIDINIKDNFDSTPLYYACLCGHYDIVKYLLHNGAKCDINTFQGERCLYGALSNSIRDLLRNYKVVTKHVIKRDPYQEFLRKIFEKSLSFDALLVLSYSIASSLDDDHENKLELENKMSEFLKIHKCILASRSQYFYTLFHKFKHTYLESCEIDHPYDYKLSSKLLQKRHNVPCYNLPLNLNKSLVKCILQYFYTGTMEFNINDYDLILALCQKFRLTYLEKQLCLKKHNIVKRQENDTQFKNTPYARNRKRNTSNCHPTYISISGDSEILKLKSDLGVLCSSSSMAKKYFSDVAFKVDDVYFYCHKLFFINRSEYFRALLMDPFREKSTQYVSSNPQNPNNEITNNVLSQSPSIENNIPVIELRDLNAQTFKYCMRYIYQDSANIDAEHVFDVLQAADKFLLPGLKRKCSAIIASHLDLDNVITVFHASRLYDLPQLEDACAKFIAQNLNEIVDKPEFLEAVKQDAINIVQRQETDTISIVDDIRFHLTNDVQTFETMRQANEKLTLLDNMLEKMGFEA